MYACTRGDNTNMTSVLPQCHGLHIHDSSLSVQYYTVMAMGTKLIIMCITNFEPKQEAQIVRIASTLHCIGASTMLQPNKYTVNWLGIKTAVHAVPD